MNEAELRQTIFQLLKKVAPDTEPEKLQPGDKIREKLDIDSFDALRFLVELDEQIGVGIPEEDYGKTTTMQDLVKYLLQKKNG